MFTVNKKLVVFYENVLNYAQYFGYPIVLCLIARSDTPFFKEIESKWNAFDSMTTNHTLFVFASDDEIFDYNYSLCYYRKRIINPTSKIYIGDKFNHTLRHIGSYIDERLVLSKYPGKIDDMHTKQIEELMNALGILERDVPCIHITYTASLNTELIKLKNDDKIWDIIKDCMEYWQPLLINFEHYSEDDTRQKRSTYQRYIKNLKSLNINKMNIKDKKIRKMIDEILNYSDMQSYNSEIFAKINKIKVIMKEKNIFFKNIVSSLQRHVALFEKAQEWKPYADSLVKNSNQLSLFNSQICFKKNQIVRGENIGNLCNR